MRAQLRRFSVSCNLAVHPTVYVLVKVHSGEWRGTMRFSIWKLATTRAGHKPVIFTLAFAHVTRHSSGELVIAFVGENRIFGHIRCRSYVKTLYLSLSVIWEFPGAIFYYFFHHYFHIMETNIFLGKALWNFSVYILQFFNFFKKATI